MRQFWEYLSGFTVYSDDVIEVAFEWGRQWAFGEFWAGQLGEFKQEVGRLLDRLWRAGI